MKNGMMKSSTGLPLDAAVLNTSEKYKQGRMPQIGDTIEFDDGRKFRFVSSVVALAAGQIAAMATASDAQLANKCTAAAAGATTVIIDNSTIDLFGAGAGIVAADRLSGGYLAITGDAGVGYMYRIKGNTASTLAGASITLTLWDPLVVALTTASDVNFIGPKYRLVVEGTATLAPVGVVMVAMAGTDEYYAWVQTRGPAIVKGTSTVGMTAECAAAGVCAVHTTADARTLGIGNALVTGADEQTVIDLCIE